MAHIVDHFSIRFVDQFSIDKYKLRVSIEDYEEENEKLREKSYTIRHFQSIV